MPIIAQTLNFAIDKLSSNQLKTDASPNSPRTRPKIPDSKLLSFPELIKHECVEGSAIDPDLFKTAVEFIEDTGHWETHQALGFEVHTQWQTRKPHDFGTLAGLKNEDNSFWQFKPEKPLTDKKGKTQKYQTPKGNGLRVFLPAIPLSVWRKICDRNHIKEESIWLRALEKGLLTLKMIDGLSKRQSDKSPRSSSDLGSPDVCFPSTETTLKDSQPKSSKGFGNASQTNDSYSSDADLAKLLKCLIETIPSDTLVPDFWGCVEEFNIDLIITEGAKKSLALLSLGTVAIALYGVRCGVLENDIINGEKVRRLKPELIPDLQRFAVKGRKITIAFDQDDKPKTRADVSAALSRLGFVLGTSGCQVEIAQWSQTQGKGVDDLIVNCGAGAWEKAHSEAISFAQWAVSRQ